MMESIEAIKQAVVDGGQAVDNLREGDVFKGAFGYANDFGYINGTVMHNLFCTSFLHRIDQLGLRVWVDKDGVITTLEKT